MRDGLKAHLQSKGDLPMFDNDELRCINPNLFDLLNTNSNDIRIIDSYMDSYLIKLIAPLTTLVYSEYYKLEIFDRVADDGIYLAKLR